MESFSLSLMLLFPLTLHLSRLVAREECDELCHEMYKSELNDTRPSEDDFTSPPLLFP